MRITDGVNGIGIRLSVYAYEPARRRSRPDDCTLIRNWRAPSEMKDGGRTFICRGAGYSRARGTRLVNLSNSSMRGWWKWNGRRRVRAVQPFRV